MLVFVASGSGGLVTLETARIVALNKIHHHVALYGQWNQAAEPTLGPGRPVHYQGEAVGYLFPVKPGGYVLVSMDDAFSPVPFYAVRADFDPARAADPNRLEAMILARLAARDAALEAFRLNRAAGAAKGFQLAETAGRIEKAWNRFADPAAVFAARTTTRQAGTPVREAAAQRAAPPVGPLLTTAWGQADPYNRMTPENSCAPAGLSTGHTLTGCVATAWAQLMKYHEWPVSGSGSHAYWWNGQQLSADFSVTYGWADMPDTLTASSDPVEIAAVSQLMYHVGVAADMDYSCTSSGSSAWADEILDTYFNYKAMNFYSRRDWDENEWFNLFKDEIDAIPPRPLIFSIFAPGIGHEVVVDGYQEDGDGNGTDMVHINFGWSGDGNGYWDVTDDLAFDAGGYDWHVYNQQFIVTGIEPNHDPRPVVSAGSDQTVNEGAAVQLSGSLITDTAAGVASYSWLQVGVADSNQRVVISDSASTQAGFKAPGVDSDTDLVFMLKATDANRSVGFDKVTVTVRPSSGGGGSSSGGCFLTALFE